MQIKIFYYYNYNTIKINQILSLEISGFSQALVRLSRALKAPQYGKLCMYQMYKDNTRRLVIIIKALEGKENCNKIYNIGLMQDLLAVFAANETKSLAPYYEGLTARIDRKL